MTPADRALLTPTALVTLDAVLEATGARIERLTPQVACRKPIVAVRLAVAGATRTEVLRSLREVRQRGLLRALVRKTLVWFVVGAEEPGGPVTDCVLHFRRAAAPQPETPR